MNRFFNKIGFYTLALLGTLMLGVITACDKNDNSSLKVVNQNDEGRTITSVSLVDYEFNNLRIETGKSQTFTFDKGMSGGYNDINVVVRFSASTGHMVSPAGKKVNFVKGETTTITLKGCIYDTYEKECNGMYLE